ncbi:MAG: hypothetical protein K5920_10230 [Bacteroidales bacterium]|nr:hypothetical protein [Bacteroidales bacterium]
MKKSIIFGPENQSLRQIKKRNMTLKQENSVERSGVAQVKSRQLDIEVPESEIIIGGVDLYKE